MKTMIKFLGIMACSLLLFASCSGQSSDLHPCIPAFAEFTEKVTKEYKDYTDKEWKKTNTEFKNHLIRMQKFNEELTFRDKIEIASLSKSYFKIQMSERPTEEMKKISNEINQ